MISSSQSGSRVSSVCRRVASPHLVAVCAGRPSAVISPSLASIQSSRQRPQHQCNSSIRQSTILHGRGLATVSWLHMLRTRARVDDLKQPTLGVSVVRSGHELLQPLFHALRTLECVCRIRRLASVLLSVNNAVALQFPLAQLGIPCPNSSSLFVGLTRCTPSGPA